MAARIAALIALLCLIAFGIWVGQPPRKNSPSKLEVSCPAGPFFVPCFIKDEGLAQQWNI
jgi:hypothetical protein